MKHEEFWGRDLRFDLPELKRKEQDQGAVPDHEPETESRHIEVQICRFRRSTLSQAGFLKSSARYLNFYHCCKFLKPLAVLFSDQGQRLR